MKLKRSTPGGGNRTGVVETFSSGINSTVPIAHSTAHKQRLARPWKATIGLRAKTSPKRWGYVVNITDGVTFVTFFGNTTLGDYQCAKLEAEFKGALEALRWFQHLSRKTPCEVRFSTEGFSTFMGEAECPSELKPLLNQLRKHYITAADAVAIDRERLALVAQEERRVAA